MIDLDDLRKKAEAATPGPWTAHPGTEAYSVTTPSAPLTWDDHGGEVFTGPNAQHIAAFNPQIALALIDRGEAAEAAVARVRALHVAAEYPLGTGSVCEECTRIQRDTDIALTGGAWADGCFTAYPCPTIRALDGEVSGL